MAYEVLCEPSYCQWQGQNLWFLPGQTQVLLEMRTRCVTASPGKSTLETEADYLANCYFQVRFLQITLLAVA